MTFLLYFNLHLINNIKIEIIYEQIMILYICVSVCVYMCVCVFVCIIMRNQKIVLQNIHLLNNIHYNITVLLKIFR